MGAKSPNLPSFIPSTAWRSKCSWVAGGDSAVNDPRSPELPALSDGMPHLPCPFCRFRRIAPALDPRSQLGGTSSGTTAVSAQRPPLTARHRRPAAPPRPQPLPATKRRPRPPFSVLNREALTVTWSKRASAVLLKPANGKLRSLPAGAEHSRPQAARQCPPCGSLGEHLFRPHRPPRPRCSRGARRAPPKLEPGTYLGIRLGPPPRGRRQRCGR